MNKLTLPIAVLALAASLFSVFSQLSSPKAVYVDVNKLLDGYAKTKVVQEEFKQKTSELKANADSLFANWQKELKSYEKEQAGYTEKEKVLKQKLLANKEQQIVQYRQYVQKQVQLEDQKVTQTIIDDINAYIKTYGEANGYKIILGARGNGNIMYADETSNLTQEILEGLNKAYEGA